MLKLEIDVRHPLDGHDKVVETVTAGLDQENPQKSTLPHRLAGLVERAGTEAQFTIRVVG
jgi:hypothetical protein